MTISKGELMAMRREAELAVIAHRGDGFAEKVVQLVNMILPSEVVAEPRVARKIAEDVKWARSDKKAAK